MKNAQIIMVAMETAWILTFTCKNEHIKRIFAAKITYSNHLSHNIPTANIQKFAMNKYEVKDGKNIKRGSGELLLKAIRAEFKKKYSP